MCTPGRPGSPTPAVLKMIILLVSLVLLLVLLFEWCCGAAKLRCAQYHAEGAVMRRCGSLAPIGIVVAVSFEGKRRPTQALEACRKFSEKSDSGLLGINSDATAGGTSPTKPVKEAADVDADDDDEED